jgi:uncharacterized membrane protein YfcA
MTEPIRLILIVAVSFFGGLIQRVTGFGYGIFVMLFFPYLIDMHTRAAAVSTFASGIISAYNAFAYRKHIPYKKLIPLVIGGLVMIPIAVGFSKMISGDFFSKLLGAVLIALSVYFLFFNNRIHLKPTTVNALIAGGTGGLLSGLFSTAEETAAEVIFL